MFINEIVHLYYLSRIFFIIKHFIAFHWYTHKLLIEMPQSITYIYVRNQNFNNKFVQIIKYFPKLR